MIQQFVRSRAFCNVVTRALGGCLVLAAASGCANRRYNDSATRANDPSPAVGAVVNKDGDVQRVIDENATNMLAEALRTIEQRGEEMDETGLCPSAAPKLRFSADINNPTIESLGYFMYLSKLSSKAPEVVGKWVGRLGLKNADYIFDATTDTHAYIFDRGSELIVSFAGTKSAANVLTDIDLVFDSALLGARVHKGFLRAYRGQGSRFKGIRSKIMAGLKAHGYPGKKVFVTGHSLGGGLASLLAAELAVIEQLGEGLHEGVSCDALKEGSNHVAGVVTFGSTRVGNQDFANCYNRILKNSTLRVVNDVDLLPLMASRAFYQHTGRRVWLDRDGVLTFNASESEEPSGGFEAFISHVSKGKFLRNVFDHVSYSHKLAYVLDKTCPKINPLAEKFGVK